MLAAAAAAAAAAASAVAVSGSVTTCFPPGWAGSDPLPPPPAPPPPPQPCPPTPQWAPRLCVTTATALLDNPGGHGHAARPATCYSTQNMAIAWPPEPGAPYCFNPHSRGWYICLWDSFNPMLYAIETSAICCCESRKPLVYAPVMHRNQCYMPLEFIEIMAICRCES